MRIVDIETHLVGNPWKNWVFLRLLTDEGIHGIGEGSLGHLSKTVETAIHEIKPLILGLEVFQTELLVTRLLRHVYADGGQIKMCAIAFALTRTGGIAAIALPRLSPQQPKPPWPWDTPPSNSTLSAPLWGSCRLRKKRSP